MRKLQISIYDRLKNKIMGSWDFFLQKKRLQKIKFAGVLNFL